MAGQFEILFGDRPNEISKTCHQDPIKELALDFIGRGPYKGFEFNQLLASKKAFVYNVNVNGALYYEVFYKRINTRFGAVSYPSPEAFGYWAWNYRTLDKAIQKFNELNWEGGKINV